MNSIVGVVFTTDRFFNAICAFISIVTIDKNFFATMIIVSLGFACFVAGIIFSF